MARIISMALSELHDQKLIKHYLGSLQAMVGDGFADLSGSDFKRCKLIIARTKKGNPIILPLGSTVDDWANLLEFAAIERKHYPLYVLSNYERSARRIAGDTRIEVFRPNWNGIAWLKGELYSHLQTIGVESHAV